MREVVITPVNNGFIVRVGCQTFVYNNIEKLAAELVRYQKDPQAVEKEMVDNALNKGDAPPLYGDACPAQTEACETVPPAVNNRV